MKPSFTSRQMFATKILFLASVCAVQTAWSQSPPVIVTSSTTDIELRPDGVVRASGTLGASGLSTSDMGAGTRMLWYPGKGAFRAGGVTGTSWDDGNIGQYSFAAGFNTTASGQYSFAAGYNSSALSTGDAAIGYASSASGTSVSLGNQDTATASSVSIGLANASNYYGVAIGHGTSASTGGTAIGYSATASGSSVAIGSNATATATSVSIGQHTQATNNSAAMGTLTVANGQHSTATGYSTTAQAYASTAIGQFNIFSGSTSNAWKSTDPLLMVGNGTSATPSDAFLVNQNGDAYVQGVLRVRPAGDLSMGTYTNGAQPLAAYLPHN